MLLQSTASGGNRPSAESADYSAKCCRNGWHNGIGEVHLAVDVVVVDLGSEGIFNLGRIAAENDELPSAGDVTTVAPATSTRL